MKRVICLSGIGIFLLLFFAHIDKTLKGKDFKVWGKNFRFFDEDSNSRKRNLRHQRKDHLGDITNKPEESPIYIKQPSNVETVIELAPDLSGYYVYERVGGKDIKPPAFIPMDEFEKWYAEKKQREYFREKAQNTSGGQVVGSLVPKLNINSSLFKDIFGSGVVDIKPNGSVLLDFAVRTNRMKNPNLSLRQQRNTSFNFDQQIQLNVVGKIGEKLKLNTNWDTKSQFNFENRFKIGYQGMEDDIVKSVEAGNVSLPLKGSLISGGQNLFGIKVGMQFGPLMVTTIASQQKGKTTEIVAKGGAQQTNFEKKAGEYDEQRHFFLSHYFRSKYEEALANLPVIASPINITRVEVWVTNRSNSSMSNNRTAVGFVDLAENDPLLGGVFYNANLQSTAVLNSLTDNEANVLYNNIKDDEEVRERNTSVTTLENRYSLKNGEDFELIENMKRLSETEYTFHPQLGYISLNSRLQQNDVLFVAYEYTVAGSNKVYRVGEFSLDKPSNAKNSNVLLLKMLKPSSVRPVLNNKPYPTWDLMMKNIYNIGGFNLKPDNFRLEIVYESTDGTGDINYLPTSDVKNIPLIQVFHLDKLRNNNELGADNQFDFIQNITIVSNKGLIIFPVLEPFGNHLVKKFNGNLADSTTYAFTPLYRRTQVDAIQFYPQLNRFKFKGTYQSAMGSEINLNAVQIAPGSIKVTSGGAQLTENVDYTVDYNVGKVNIINPGILTSGQEIRITFETNTLFNIDQKTMVGTRLDYRVSKDIQLGGTILHLNERPLINKINMNEEPLSNTIWGVDAAIKKDSRLITTLLDKLPLINTKEISSITFNGEFAQMIPGHPHQIGNKEEKGISYIDDFEGTRSVVDLMGEIEWKIASKPYSLSPDNDTATSELASGYRRAKLAWYRIDPVYYDQPKDFGYDSQSPSLNDHFSRRVTPNEVFKKITTTAGTNVLRTLDIRYFPDQRGFYNYQTNSAKVGANGKFLNPRENWAGIMRRTSGNTDFEAANFEFIEFWIMDPFIKNPNHPGVDMFFNLGKISEDVLNDNRRAYENGLGLNNQSQTIWGNVPDINMPTNAFDNNQELRKVQDVGLDGLTDEDEKSYRQEFLNQIQNTVTDPTALQAIQEDPSSDNYQFHRDLPQGTFLPERYLNHNGQDGNSPINAPGETISKAATVIPDIEDLNLDGTLNTTESYYEYKIRLEPSQMNIGQNYIVDKVVSEVKLENGRTENVTWYQFRVPLKMGTPINGIQDFKAIDFIRMYFTNATEETFLRFARLQLVATQWRSFKEYLGPDGPTTLPEPDPNNTFFEIGTINIEDNGDRYVMPPRIQRQAVPGAIGTGILQNEQSLVLRTCNLQEGDARGTFKIVNFDMRNYKNLKMWVHAIPNFSGSVPPNFSNCGELKVFLRLGTDLTNNYYEYEMPVCPSDINSTDQMEVWKNEMVVSLNELNVTKQRRNDLFNQGLITYNDLFSIFNDKGHKITIIGNPQLSNVKSIMVGVRNPEDNGLPQCVEVWVNELRATDFDEFPGYAANGRLNLKLADIANISLSGQKMTPGFGSIEKKLNERSREDLSQYDITGNVQLGKLIPKKIGIDLPVYFSYGERLVTPQFNPLDPDIKAKDAIAAQPTENRKTELKEAFEDYTRNRSISFNNVRKLKSPNKKKTYLWDISNFTATFGYTEQFHRSSTISNRTTQQWIVGLDYTYNFQSKPFEPFKNAKKKNIITAFNINFLPKTISVRLDANRRYEENQLRTLLGRAPIAPTYNQNFLLNRTYNLQWDLFKSLGINYSATNQARVDEPQGPIDTQEKKDSLWDNVFSYGKDPANNRFRTFNMGRNLQFQQNLNIQYRLPFNYIKPLNWITTTASYQATYLWQTAALQNQSLGNTVSNSRNIQVNSQLNMAQLYKKFPFIQKWLKPIPKKNIISKSDSSRKEDDDAYVGLARIGKFIGNMIFSIQTIDINYSRNQQTALPGYMPQTDNFGIDFGYRDSLGRTHLAPGIPFVLGHQPKNPKDFLEQMARQGFLSNDPRLAQKFLYTDNQQLTARTAFSVFKGFKVNVTLNRSQSENYSQLYSRPAPGAEFTHSNEIMNGNYSASFIGLKTLFNSDKAFANFDNFRRTISRRLSQANPRYGTLGSLATETNRGFFNGYNGNSQDVLIPAFLAAYGGKNPERVKLSPFGNIPLPNWDVNYNGLSDLDFLKDIFKTVTLTHAYRSTYSLNYMSNISAVDNDRDGFAENTFDNGVGEDIFGNPLQLQNFYSIYNIQAITITEAFAPLIGLNFAWKNGLTTTVDFKKSRNLTFNVGALQVSEMINNELTLNFNWRKEGLQSPINLFGKELNLKNNITFRFEVTFRGLKSQNRRLDATTPPEPTGGNNSFTVKPSIDYMLNTRLTARAYYEYNRNKPVLNTSFPSSFSAFGIQFRFSLN